MKKGQMQAQIFIYVMVLVVGVGILLYGYTAIKGFKKQADDVLYLEFESAIKSDLKAITFESVKVKQYNLPTVIEQVCFKGPNAVASDVVLEQQRQASLNKEYRYPLIESAIGPSGAGTDNSVFIYPRGERAFNAGVVIDFGELDQNAVPKEFKCFDVKQGILKIRIKGQGRSVLVTDAT